MAQRSFPFDGPELDTAQWARLTAALAGDGVVPNLGDELAVITTSPETLAVRVSTGDAFIRGRHFQVHSGPQTVPLAAADVSNPRIDRIVVRRDLTAGTVEVGVVTGTPAVSPTAPSLTREVLGVWEEPLRQVFVRANATSVRGSDLQDGQGFLSTVDRVWASTPLGPGQRIDSDMRDYVDASVAQGVVDRAEHTSGQASISSEADLAGLSVTVDLLPGRWYRVWAKTEFNAQTPPAVARMRLYAGTSGIQGSANESTASSSGASSGVEAEVIRTFSGGSTTLKATLERVSGSGSLTSRASLARPAQLAVIDLGPA